MAKLLIRHYSKETNNNQISIMLDGEHIGDIKNGGFLEFPLVAGKRNIYANIGGRKSEVLSFDIEDREQIQFSVWSEGALLKKPVIKKDFQTKLRKRFLEYAPHDPPHKANNTNDTTILSNKIEWESILGVKPSSDSSELRKAFINLMKQYHPDKTIFMSDDEKKKANARAAEITMAYAYAKSIRKRMK